jgi:DNA-binding GntR family transcriptional regulator
MIGVTVARTSNVAPVSSVTRREAVLSELRGAILSGKLQPGERLKEVQLSQDLGVSRPTLREAIYQLIHEGLLVQEAYKGVTVVAIDAETISDIAVVRSSLETIAAKAIATDKDDTGRKALRQAYEEYAQAAASNDPVRETAAHLALHETIWMASGNIMLRRIWPIVSASINLALSTDTAVRHDSDRNRRMHRELVEAILDNKHRRITTAVREHIQVSAGELLDILSERDGEPGHWSSDGTSSRQEA